MDKSSGQIIMSLCDEVGITRNELARRLGISPSQISRIINEETKTISSEILIALAREFHVSADYILGLTDEKIQIRKHMITAIMEFAKHQQEEYPCCL